MAVAWGDLDEHIDESLAVDVEVLDKLCLHLSLSVPSVEFEPFSISMNQFDCVL